jgi:hypothetical protein
MMRAAFLGVLGLALAGAAPAYGQAMNQDELLKALKQRDDAIAALEKRVAALEAREGSAVPSATAAGAPATAIATLPAPGHGAASASASVGAGVSDDDAALQAISRGLVARGVLLLPKGTVEVTPSLAYNHSIRQGLTLVDTPEGISTVSDQRLRDDGAIVGLGLRVGLPWSSQLQVSAPYGWMQEISSLGDGSQSRSSVVGVGDVSVELSHQFLNEGRYIPSLVAAVGWIFPTGSDPYRTAVVAGVANGGGVNQGTARLTVLKSFDPMVFFATLSYAHSLSIQEPYGRVTPGDVYSAQLGGLLSVSPDTSLSLSFRQDFRGATSVNGTIIAGSDQVPAIVQLGIDQVITRKILLDVSLGIGVTRDAPNYVLAVSLPIRFY